MLSARASAPPATALDEESAVTLEFARRGKRIRVNRNLPLLEAAESHGIELDYGCRTGNCGDCRVRVIQGKFASGSDSGLSPQERASGWALSCVATPSSDCVLDA